MGAIMTQAAWRAMLIRADYAALVQAALRSKRVLSQLLALTYDADDLIGWRAVKALGLAAAPVADADLEFVRNILRRLMWSLNDESGGIGWRSPQAMGAILAQRPRELAEFIPIVISLFDLDESHFYPGVLWAIGHMAEHGAEGLEAARLHVLHHLASPDAAARGMAAWCAGQLGLSEAVPALGRLLQDQATLWTFEDDQLCQWTVGELAQAALKTCQVAPTVG